MLNLAHLDGGGVDVALVRLVGDGEVADLSSKLRIGTSRCRWHAAPLDPANLGKGAALHFMTTGDPTFRQEFGGAGSGHYLRRACFGGGIDFRIKLDDEFGDFVPKASVDVADDVEAWFELGDFVHDTELHHCLVLVCGSYF